MGAVVDKATGLTTMQEAFCVAFVKSRNGVAAQAYREAFNAAESSSATVWTKSTALMKKPKIRARIAALRANAVRKQEISIDEVLKEAACIAFLDPVCLFDAAGNLRAINDIPEDARRAIASIHVFRDGTVKVNFCDKMAALEQLLRFLGAYVKHNAQRQSLLDEVPRETLREIERYLIEVASEREAEKSCDGSAGQASP